ncbi:MAG: hypothetical protein ACYC5J_20500 [Chloroflexota bacterium]
MALRIGRFVEMATVRGEPLEVAGSRIVPVARVLSVSIGWPGFPAARGGVWVRPAAVEVTDAAGSRRVAIPDVGTMTLLGLMAVVGLLSLLSALRRSRG